MAVNSRLAILALLGAVCAIDTAQAAPVPFRIGAVELTMPLPAGFCEPSKNAAAAVQLLAAADDVNLTHLTMLPCDDGSLSKPDYVIVKTPKTMLLATLTRETLLAELAKVFDATTYKPLPGTNDNIEKRFEELVGEHPEILGAVKPLGRDDICSYMGGVLP